MQKNIFLVVCGEFLEMNYTRRLLKWMTVIIGTSRLQP